MLYFYLEVKNLTVGENIRKYRKEKGLTQKKLAELTQLNEVTIRSYEAGKYKPKFEQLRKIAIALDIGLDVFMTADELSLFNDMTSLYLESDSDLKLLDSLEETSTQEHFLIASFRELNEVGQKKIIDYTEDISKIDEYKKGSRQ